MISFPQNLSTILECLEKLLLKANLTNLIFCHGDHWRDLKYIQITRTTWTVRINWGSQDCSAWTRGGLRGASLTILECRLPRKRSQSLYWGCTAGRRGKNGHKFRQVRFWRGIRKKKITTRIIKHTNRLLRAAVKPLSLEVFKTWWYKGPEEPGVNSALSVLSAGGRTGWPAEIPFRLILWLFIWRNKRMK